MARNKTQCPPTLCTFCGNPATPVTRDHVFPRALWPEPSNDRPPMVPSCQPCNNHSNESILRHFFIALDRRFYSQTINHFRDPRGMGDLRTFLSMWAERDGKFYLYLDEQVTAKFVKTFMGIRRALMGNAWFFMPADRFQLCKIDGTGDQYDARMLPMRVGGPNPARPFGSEYTRALDDPMRYKFRDFSYQVFCHDEDGMVLGIRYERRIRQTREPPLSAVLRPAAGMTCGAG